MVIFGNRGKQQVRRYPVLKTGIKVGDIHGFVGNQKNAILHVMWTAAGEIQWFQTFDGPVVKVSSTASPGTYYPDFVFTNPEGTSFTVKKAVKVSSGINIEDNIMEGENKRMFKKAEHKN